MSIFLWSYDDVSQIIISCLTNYHFFICGHIGFEEGIIHIAGLLEQEEQEEDWRAAWINLHLDKVWTILISDLACIYLHDHLHPPFNSTLMAS